jgi:hypothetical protein
MLMTAADSKVLVPIVQITKCHVTEACSLELHMVQGCRHSEFGILEHINVLVSLIIYCNTVSGSTVTSHSYKVSAPQAH